MKDEDKPQLNTSRTFNDVAGAGEGVKAIFSFFEKIIDKLPFSKITPAQTQFLVIFVIVNLLVTVMTIWGKISPNTFYFLFAFDVLAGAYSMYLASKKD